MSSATVDFDEYAEQVEQSLFSHLSHNPSAAATLTLTPEQFSTPFRGTLYEVFRRLAVERTPFERRLVHRYIQAKGITPEPDWHDIFSYIGSDTPGDPAIIRKYEMLLLDISARREYLTFLDRHINDARNMKSPMTDTLQSHAQVLAVAQSKVNRDIAPDAKSIYEREKMLLSSSYFPSGLTTIDNNVRGLRPGHIWVISAGYKGRKTTVALNIAKNVLKDGKHVMYVALEDDDISYFDTMTAIWGDIPYADIDVPPSQHPQKVQNTQQEIIATNFRVYDSRKGVHNWKLLPSMVAADKLRYGQVDLLVIDFIQAYSARYEDLQQIIPMIQRLAGEEHIAVLVLSQMNNADLSTQEKNMDDSLLHTKSSGDIGALCHVGIEIYRDMRVMDELMLMVKVARKGHPQRTFCKLNPASGTLYANTKDPLVLVDWQDIITKIH